MVTLYLKEMIIVMSIKNPIRYFFLRLVDWLLKDITHTQKQPHPSQTNTPPPQTHTKGFGQMKTIQCGLHFILHALEQNSAVKFELMFKIA